MLKPFGLMLMNVDRRFVHTTFTCLKGHAKWQNVKHVKAENDRMRQAMILKQLRNLRLAAIGSFLLFSFLLLAFHRKCLPPIYTILPSPTHLIHTDGGSPNPEINSTLRNAIDEARRRDVPLATIQGFLKKFTETKDKSQLQRHLFEGRAYKKLNLIVSIYTDKLAHVKVQMATIYRKHLIESANVKRLFDERGVLHVIARDGIDVNNFEDDCTADAIECGAEDIEVFDATERKVTFFCDPKEFLRVRNRLIVAGYTIEHSECSFFPSSNCNLAQLNEAELKDYNKIKDKLTQIEGFDEVYDNLENDDGDENSWKFVQILISYSI